MIEEPFLRVQDGPCGLEEGYYLLQFRRSRRVDIPFKIWFGAPIDPETREELDRSHRWQIEIAGVAFDQPLTLGGIQFSEVDDFWPMIARDRVDALEYNVRVKRAAWSQAHDPDDAMATPGGRINAMTATLPGM